MLVITFYVKKEKIMSLSAFFSQTKTQIRSAILSHPIEIFMITAFAIGIWFTDMSI